MDKSFIEFEKFLFMNFSVDKSNRLYKEFTMGIVLKREKITINN